MCRKAQFMPQAIHESTAFNSRNRKVAIHCVFSVKDNTLNHSLFFFYGYIVFGCLGENTYTTPCANIASATLIKPAMFAPATRSPAIPYSSAARSEE